MELNQPIYNYFYVLLHEKKNSNEINLKMIIS